MTLFAILLDGTPVARGIEWDPGGRCSIRLLSRGCVSVHDKIDAARARIIALYERTSEPETVTIEWDNHD